MKTVCITANTTTINTYDALSRVTQFTNPLGVFTAGHGESAWKVFKEEKTGLRWFKDADQYGTYLTGKHKGPVGEFIPWKNTSGR